MIDDPACKAAAKTLIVAAERLQQAIFDASPEDGQALLSALDLAGATFTTTVRRIDPARFIVNVGVVDRETARGLETFELEFVRTDASVLPVLAPFAH